MTSTSRILIILLGSLGDVVRALSLTNPIKNAYPESHITWLVDSRWDSLVRCNRYIDEVLVLDRKLSFQSIREIRKQLQSNNYDLVLDLQRIFKSGLLSFFSKANRRIAFNTRNSKELNYLFNTETIPYYPDSLSKIHHYHQFLRHLGIESSEPYDFGLDFSKKLKFDLPDKYIAFVLGSSWESKDWPPSGYFQLAKRIIAETDYSIILLGDQSQVPVANELSKNLSEERIISLAGKTDLIDLALILKSATSVVGPDSGPGHLSAAVKTAYISLFGPTAPERVAPYGYEDLALRTEVVCSPCMRKTCPGLNKVCMRLIEPQQVFEKLAKQL